MGRFFICLFLLASSLWAKPVPFESAEECTGLSLNKFSLVHMEWSKAQNGLLLTVDSGGGVAVYDTKTKALQTLEFDTHNIPLAAFHPDLPNIIALAFPNGKVTLYDTETRVISELGRHQGTVVSLLWNPSRTEWLATMGEDQKVRVWNTEAQEQIAQFDAHVEMSYRIDWHKRDANRLAFPTARNTTSLWDIYPDATFSHVTDVVQNGTVIDFELHPRWPDVLASLVDRKRIDLWITSKQEIRNTLTGHSHTMFKIKFSERNFYFVGAAGLHNPFLDLWSIAAPRPEATLEEPGGMIVDFDWNEAHLSWVATAAFDGLANIWYVPTARLWKSYSAGGKAVSIVRFNPLDGNIMAAVSQDRVYICTNDLEAASKDAVFSALKSEKD